MTPTRKSLAILRKNGYTATVVEHWNGFAGVRQDLWKFGDILAVHPTRKDFLIVQCTTSGVAARVRKIREIPAALDWLRAGGRVQVWGWTGKRLRRVAITLAGVLKTPRTKPIKRVKQGELF
jgi:hypothetical protein